MIHEKCIKCNSFHSNLKCPKPKEIKPYEDLEKEIKPYEDLESIFETHLKNCSKCQLDYLRIMIHADPKLLKIQFENKETYEEMKKEINEKVLEIIKKEVYDV